MTEKRNMYYQKYTALKKENEELKQDIEYLKGQLKAYSEACPNGSWVLNERDVE